VDANLDLSEDRLVNPHPVFPAQDRDPQMRAACYRARLREGVGEDELASISAHLEQDRALGEFLGQFGQLLEIDVLGEVEYYYNITNVIDCIDHDRSNVLPGGFIKKPVFKDSAIPTQAAIFKDATHRSSIYVNDAAKSELEKRIAESGITGMSFRKA
jgi:hypothetical protein